MVSIDESSRRRKRVGGEHNTCEKEISREIVLENDVTLCRCSGGRCLYFVR